MEFDDIYWHDGNLLDIHITFEGEEKKRINIVLIAEVYEKYQASTRKKLTVIFKEVDNFLLSSDCIELITNFKCGGHISHGYSKDPNKYRIFLADGYIDIATKKIKLVFDQDQEMD